MIDPIRFLEDLAIPKEKFDEVCAEIWGQYLKNRQGLRESWAIDECVARSPEKWLSHSKFVFRNIEDGARQELLRTFKQKLALPEQIGFEQKDGGKPFADGFRSTTGAWINWNSDAEEPFQTEIGGIVLWVEIKVRPSWSEGGTFQILADYQRAASPKDAVISAFEVRNSWDSADRSELEDRLAAIHAAIERECGEPLSNDGFECWWGTGQYGGLMSTRSNIAKGDVEFESYFSATLERPGLNRQLLAGTFEKILNARARQLEIARAVS